MRRLAAPFAAVALLAAGLFAAVSIAQGGGLSHLITTGLTTTTGGKVAVCHRTGSKRHPFHTIVVAAPAVRAHVGHGDVLGSCTTATVAAMTRRGKGPVKHTTTATTTATTTTTASATQAASGSHGNAGGNGNGNGNRGGNGNGNGNGGGNGNGNGNGNGGGNGNGRGGRGNS